ncbi:MAG: hypothetical protein EOP92_40295, partial [Lysobacteraceae bacterium]
MRIVIDFLHARDGIEPATLDFIKVLAAAAGPRELWIAAPLGHPALLDDLRLAFPGRVRAFDLPARLAGERLAAALREHALAGLSPDVVLVPAQAPRAAPKLPFPVLYRDPRDPHGVPALLLELDASAAERVSRPQAARPKLAYVSPLPPVKSGIADYSAELVPELARYYDIELVVDQDSVLDARLEGFPMRSPDWLRAHAHEVERVVYHVGNSHAHQHMFALIRDVPGIVVLHDFYFSGVLDNLEREGYLPQAFVKALYESHGYTGLLSHRKEGRNPSIWKYPLNKGVLDNAAGVIVHADFSKELATQWYGPEAAEGWQTIPLLRGRPQGSGTPQARAAARARLGIGEG